MRWTVPLALVALVAACTSSDGAAPDGGPSDGGIPDAGSDVDTDGGGDALVLNLPGTVAADVDTYRCWFVTVPRDLLATRFAHTYGTGNHHLLVFLTDLASNPSPTSDVDCYAGAPDAMSHARAQIYGSQSRDDALALPPGVAFPLHAGQVLLVQLHDLDATAAPLDATAKLTIEGARDPASVPTRAGAYLFRDPFLDVEPGQRAHAAVSCPFPSAVTVISASGYAHERAVAFAATLDAGEDAGAGPAFYRAPGWSNPLPAAVALPVPAGGRVRFTCDYDNAHGTAAFASGPRLDADEDCVVSGLYAPDLGDDVSQCATGGSGFGVGTSACPATRACLDACPVHDARPDLGAPFVSPGTVNACAQACVARSCPSTWPLVVAARACAASQGNTPDGGADGGACAEEEAACAADPCR